MNEEQKFVFTNDEGQPEEFYIIEETTINNNRYILVADSLEDEATAYIFKDMSDESSEDAVFERIEDDAEIEYIGKIFAELLDDGEFGLE